MADFKKMTVASLRELARKLLGRGHSRLKTKADLLKALEGAEAAVEAASARAVSRVRRAATRAVETTGKAVRAAGSAVEAAARKGGKPAPGARTEPAAKKAAPAGRGGGAAKKATADRGGAAGARQAAGSKPKAAAGKKAGAPEAARARRKVASAAPAGPDPEGFFVARIRGEEAVREAPHPMTEPATEAEEEGAPPYDERLGDLPWGYGDDAFLALPRDPRTLFLYWDLGRETARRGFADLDHPRAQLWLFARAGPGWDRVRAIDFALESRGYYVHDLEPGRTYRAEIRAVDRQGRDRLMGHGSNEVTLPAQGPSALVDDRFVRIPWDLPLGRLLGPGRAGAPFPDELRALLARLSDWSRFAAGRGGSAGGMGGRPTSSGGPPRSGEGR